MLAGYIHVQCILSLSFSPSLPPCHCSCTMYIYVHVIVYHIVPTDSAHSNHGLVPFASQYVAHHLREDTGGVATSPQGTSSNSPLPMTAGQNSTRNLANLSRLFRQLRPHVLQNINSHTKPSQKQIDEVINGDTPSLKHLVIVL